VKGTIRMTRHALPGDNKITVRGTVSGMPAGDHSFHFHEYGDMTSEGTAIQATNPVYEVPDMPFTTVS
jgi:Cu/Zn superoxide dismutase